MDDLRAPNPYTPPSVETGATETRYVLDHVTQATQGERFLNFLLDTVLAAFTAAFMAGFFGALIGELEAGWEESLAFQLTYYAGTLLYYIAFESLLGRTPAKWITGTRVVRRDGGKPGLGAVLLRTLVRYVPFEPFSFLGNPVGWHDSWSKTRVISVRRKSDGDGLPVA